MIHRAPIWALALALGACASPRDQADTSSVLATDTIKPATTAIQSPSGTTTSADTTPARRSSTATTKSKTSPTPTVTKTPTKTATKQGETKELGRDSIIRIDTKDRRRMLPPADSTTKKP